MFQISLFTYSLQLPSGALHCTEVSKERCDTVPCFYHITRALDSGQSTVTQEIRNKTIEHIKCYLRSHKLAGLDASRIEGFVYTRSGRALQIYKNMLDDEPAKYREYNRMVAVRKSVPVQQRALLQQQQQQIIQQQQQIMQQQQQPLPVIVNTASLPAPGTMAVSTNAVQPTASTQFRINPGPPTQIALAPAPSSQIQVMPGTQNSVPRPTNFVIHATLPTAPSAPPAPIQAAPPRPTLPSRPDPNIIQQLSGGVTCPLCQVKFSSLRSKAFYIHVATFHMPMMDERNKCDVQGCNFAFSSRVQHIEHVSYHTSTNDSIFLKGLEKLHDHYAQPQVWKVVSELERKPLDFTDCPLCNQNYSAREAMLRHLTFAHFSPIIKKNLGSVPNCPFRLCPVKPASVNECILHVGIRHAVVITLLGEDCENATNISCPCCRKFLNGMQAFLMHMVEDHCRDSLSNEVSRLQELKGLKDTMCPISSCGFIASNQRALISHYGVQHGAAMDVMLSQKDMAKMTAVAEMVSKFRMKAIGTEPRVCTICLRVKNKRMQYCHQEALMLHLSITHFLAKLRTHYLQKLDGGDGRCLVCKVHVKQEMRALHAGVVHEEALALMAASANAKATPTVSIAPQQRDPSPKTNKAIITCTPVGVSETVTLESPQPLTPVVNVSDATDSNYTLNDAVLQSGEHCRRVRFVEISDLMEHLQSQQQSHQCPHKVATCVCCNYHQKLDGSERRRMTLHALSKSHLFNQWRLRHAQRHMTPDRREVDPVFLDVCEPCGGEKVTDLDAHVSKQMHKENTEAVSDFVGYCELRGICPVTCTAKDVCFFLELYASREKAKMKPSRLVNVISRIHDPVDGQELLGLPDVEDKVGKLMYGGGAESSEFKLICYSCPHGAADAESMLVHCRGAGHLNTVRYRTISKAKNLIRCSPCEKSFQSTSELEVHKHDKQHFANFPSDAPPPPSPAPEKIETKDESPKKEVSTTALPSPTTKGKENSHPYSQTLSVGEISTVVRCPKCHQTFRHATYLLLHLRKLHSVSPTKLLSANLKKGRPVNCSFCTRRCRSPLAFALHHDTHQVRRLVNCSDCSKSHASPYGFYMNDSCGKNNVGEAVKEEVAEAVFKMVFKKNQGGVIGADSDDDEEEIVDNKDDESPEKKKSLMNESKRWGDSDDEYLPDADDSEAEKDDDVQVNKVSSESAKKRNRTLSDLVDMVEDNKDSSKAKVAIRWRERELAEQYLKEIKEAEKAKVEKKSKEIMEAEKAKVEKKSKEIMEAVKVREEETIFPQKKEIVKPKPLIMNSFVGESEDSDADDPLPLSVLRNKMRRKRPAASTSSSTTSGSDKQAAKTIVPKLSKPTTNSPARSVSSSSSSIGTQKRKSRESHDEDKTPEPASKKSKLESSKKEMKTKKDSNQTEKKDKSDNKNKTEKKGKLDSNNKMEKEKLDGNNKAEKKSKNKSKKNKMHFCLDCEKCRAKSCKHTEHARTTVSDVQEHIQESGHRRFQPVASFLSPCSVKMLDLAYTQEYGNKIRKKFKSSVLSGFFEAPKQLDGSRRCRMPGCEFKTSKVLEVFRHIRDNHLKSSED